MVGVQPVMCINELLCHKRPTLEEQHVRGVCSGAESSLRANALVAGLSVLLSSGSPFARWSEEESSNAFLTSCFRGGRDFCGRSSCF